MLEYVLINTQIAINIYLETRKMADEKKRKNPKIALILSAIFPGLGQIYVKQIPKGVVLIALNLIINYLLINFLVLSNNFSERAIIFFSILTICSSSNPHPFITLSLNSFVKKSPG